MGVTDVIRRLDAYPKIEDVTIRTYTGAAVTIFSTALVVFLIFLEYQTYLAPPTTEELFVDMTQNDILQVNLDITVPRVSCHYLTLDAMDSTGDMHPEIDATIFKQRLDAEGNPIESNLIKHEIETIKTAKNKTHEEEVTNSPKCGSCYGAEVILQKVNETMCCNTCEEVVQAYRDARWDAKMDNFEQCKNRSQEDKDALVNAFKEGCRIYGSMNVTRMEGNFHIAPGKSFSFRRVHFHEVSPKLSMGFNLTHIINHLSFGPAIEFVRTSPLDGLVVTDEKKDMAMFQYFLKIVPTMHVKRNGDVTHTNQFSVTRDQRRIASGDPGLIALFFTYELSPLMVKYTEQTASLGHFATNVCSIVGGVFTVAGLLVSFLHNSMKVLEEKIELGKLS